MIRKLVRMAATFALLAAGYFGYLQAFALVTRHLDQEMDVPILPYDPSPSRSAREAQLLALTAFGPGHWAIKAKIKYYDSQRGYWIFADDYSRKDEGKRYEFQPFALIWRHRTGTALKTVTSDQAAILFNQAPDMVRGSSNEATRVVQARIEGNVRVRDDKGTPDQLGDDLTIAMADLDYDEEKETIHSESRVEIRDRDTVGTAEGLAIELRPSESALRTGTPTGYSGARTVTLLRDVRITVQDVGRTGLVPGGATQTEPAEGGREPRPGEITCDGEMRIELPAPVPTPRVGPPAPQGPTMAHFARNVRVRQGDAQAPEQLDCDRLHLTLLPGEKKRAKVAQVEKSSDPEAENTADELSVTPTRPDPADGGPVSELALDRAHATGHAVWLQSRANGLIGRGNELTYQRGPEGSPATSYFRGDRETEIRKENAAQGTIDVIRTVDITLYHGGPASEANAVVARGPGWMETRRLVDQVVLRTARWREQVVLQPVQDDPTRRQLTLEGDPEVRDVERGTLAAKRKIVASLVSKPKESSAAVEGQAASSSTASLAPGGGSFRIELMQAWENVTLVANAPKPEPNAKADARPLPRQAITAHEWLGVVFEESPNPAAAEVADRPTTPDDGPAAEIAEATPPDPTKQAAAAKPGPPPIQVEADRIWAWIRQDEAPAKAPTEASRDAASPLGGSAWAVRQVRLRGAVLAHQDPPPGKARGMDIQGEEVDLIHLGNKLYEVRAYGGDAQPARARTDEFLIEGPVLGLDQAKHYACVIGPGTFVQENAGDGILGAPGDGSMSAATVIPTRFDGDPDAPVDAKPTAKPRGPLSISWGRAADGSPLKDDKGQPIESWMKFYGQPNDERGLPAPARVHFHNSVRAWTSEALLTCSQMWAYLDEPVDFQKASRPRQPADVATPRKAPATIARVVCEDKVDIVTRKLDDEGNVIEKRRIQGDRVVYDRPTNRFHIDSAGVVHLYDRGEGFGPGGLTAPRRPAAPIATPGNANVRPAAYQAGAQPPVSVVRSQRRPAPVGLPPLKLTSIRFDDEMIGQLASTPQAGKRLAGQAEFFGNTRVIHAEVPNEETELDPDDPPTDYIYTVSRTLRVISEPPSPEAPPETPDRILVQAWGDVFALAGRGGRETAIQASDHMDYNSETGVSYVYGGDAGVTIVDQTGAGQPASYGRGSTVVFNHRTGEHRLLDARSFQLVDPRSGVRAGIPPAPPPRPNPAPRRDPFPRTPRSDKERRNFEGR